MSGEGDEGGDEGVWWNMMEGGRRKGVLTTGEWGNPVNNMLHRV